MSVTFSSDAPETTTLVKEHCLCAQMVEGFMKDATPEALRAAADPRCVHCGGSGVEEVPQTDGPHLNFSNGNAHAVISALRLGAPTDGSCSIPEARRAVIRARSGSVGQFVRPESIVYGKPRSDGNVVIARPIRSADPGLSAEGITARIDAFVAFVEACATRGAKNIHWG